MEQMQVAVTWLLRMGVLFALLLVAAGGILYVVQHGDLIVNYSIFQGEPAQEKSVTGILLAVPTLSARSLIQLGVFVLALTQIVRVMCVAWFFSKIKDYTFAGISLFVLLAVVIISFGGFLQ